MNEFMIMNFLSRDSRRMEALKLNFIDFRRWHRYRECENFPQHKIEAEEQHRNELKTAKKSIFFCCWLQDVNLCTHFKTLECIIESLNVVCARMLTWSFIEDTAQMRKNTRRTHEEMRKLGEFQNFKISLRKSLENEKMSTHEFFSSWFSSSEFLIVIFK